MHLHRGSNFVVILPRNRKKNKHIRLLLRFFHSQIRMKPKNKHGLHPSLCDFYPPNWNEDQNKKVLFNDFIVSGFIVRCLFYCAMYVFCAMFDRHVRIKTKEIRKKIFPAYPVWGMLNFP